MGKALVWGGGGDGDDTKLWMMQITAVAKLDVYIYGLYNGYTMDISGLM